MTQTQLTSSRNVNPVYAAQRKRPSPVIWAQLPQAPRTASSVPELTSLWHDPSSGPWGDGAYPGNCSGTLIHALLRFYTPTRVYDPMSGSGTCRDVCRDLRIDCWSGDIHHGFDACEPPPEREAFDFCFLHPPYWRQKVYAADPRDLWTSPRMVDTQIRV